MVLFLIQAAADSSERAAAQAAATEARRIKLIQASNILVAACRRLHDTRTHINKMTTSPSVPSNCFRLASAIQVNLSFLCSFFICVVIYHCFLYQESKLSHLFLIHVIDSGITDDIILNVTIKGLLESHLTIDDALKLFNAIQAYNKAHAAANAAVDALHRSIEILERSSQILRHLTINDVLEIRGMTTPSPSVKLLMKCVCLVLSVKPSVKLDALRQPVHDYWEPTKQHLLTDPKVFLERLWQVSGKDIDDAVVQEVEECLEHPEMADDRLRRITKSSVKDIANWLRAVCQHHRAKLSASKESSICSASASASKRLFISPEEPAALQEDIPFKLNVQRGSVDVPAIGCGVLIVLAFGPKVNVSIKDIQIATGQVLQVVETVVATMIRKNVLQQDKVVRGQATFSITVGSSFDAATAARHCKTFGFFKSDLSYSLQVKMLSSLATSVYEKKPSTVLDRDSKNRK
jgi:hypothetical protein